LNNITDQAEDIKVALVLWQLRKNTRLHEQSLEMASLRSSIPFWVKLLKCYPDMVPQDIKRHPLKQEEQDMVVLTNDTY
jgi:hypothetical protein